MNQDQEIISRYIGQPARLPAELRARIEREWGNQPVQLYALADLDHGLRLHESWVALGPRHVALARPAADGAWQVHSVERARIRAVQEAPGLSANTLLLLSAPDDPPLAVVRYTQRQRGAFENIRFVLDESLEGRTVESEDADRVYADAVARPVRDAQALVAGRQSAVILRLLRYLTRYRRELTLGLTAAAIVTLASPRPYGAFIGQDLNRDSDNTDDFFPSGAPDGERTIHPGNDWKYWYRNVDLRVGKSLFTAQGTTVRLTAEVFNVFNTDNIAGFGGIRQDAAGQPLSNFGKPTSAFGARRAQVGARFEF